VADPPVQIDVLEEVGDGMLGRQDPQMDLTDAVLWTGKIEPKPLVEKGSFHDRFATVRGTIRRDEDFAHWFDAEQGQRSVPPSVVAGAFLLALREQSPSLGRGPRLARPDVVGPAPGPARTANSSTASWSPDGRATSRCGGLLALVGAAVAASGRRWRGLSIEHRLLLDAHAQLGHGVAQTGIPAEVTGTPRSGAPARPPAE
jgi:hypothetical protein